MKTVTKKKPARAKAKPAEKAEDELFVRSVSDVFRHRSYVIYGRSGTGKTTIGGSFPKPILFLNIGDQGTDSIADLGEDVKVRDINTWDDFEFTYWWLVKNPGKYNSLVLDTVTQLQQCAIIKVLEDANKQTQRAGDWGVMTKREWGQVASLMKMWITNIRDLPMETLFLAQERVSESETEDPEVMLDPEVGPRLSPSIAAHLNAEVSVIGSTFIRRRVRVKKVNGKKKEFASIQYCLRLGPDPVYITKARKPKAIKLPPVLINPSYDEIVATLKGERDGS